MSSVTESPANLSCDPPAGHTTAGDGGGGGELVALDEVEAEALALEDGDGGGEEVGAEGADGGGHAELQGAGEPGTVLAVLVDVLGGGEGDAGVALVGAGDLGVGVERVDEGGLGLDRGGQVDESREGLDAHADGQVGKGVHLQAGVDAEGVVHSGDGLPAGGGRGLGVEEVEVDLAVGEGGQDAGLDGDGAGGGQLNAEAKGQHGADVEDAGDGEGRDGGIERVELDALGGLLGGGDGGGQVEGQGGVVAKVDRHLGELQLQEVKAQSAADADVSGVLGDVGGDGEGTLVDERLARQVNGQGDVKAALALAAGGGRPLDRGVVHDVLDGGHDGGGGDGGLGVVEGEGADRVEAALAVGGTAAIARGDEDKVLGGPLLLGRGKVGGRGEGDDDRVLGGAGDALDGGDGLEDDRRQLHVSIDGGLGGAGGASTGRRGAGGADTQEGTTADGERLGRGGVATVQEADLLARDERGRQHLALDHGPEDRGFGAGDSSGRGRGSHSSSGHRVGEKEGSKSELHLDGWLK
ncbi:hypothetical protein PspLS_00996 [Pyricularia sp. CBS 133598]|nr:hypothetical protein PspLS_00996 [Pyricularia sp. CBS 133598]